MNVAAQKALKGKGGIPSDANAFGSRMDTGIGSRFQHQPTPAGTPSEASMKAAAVMLDPWVSGDLSDVVKEQPTWTPRLRCIPSYYPMERSIRILSLEERPLSEITRDIRECLRIMSIQAKLHDDPAGAALLSADQVEMYLYFWETAGGRSVCVEIQRRHGDSVAFHKYGRHILEASGGDFDVSEYNGWAESHYLRAADKLLKLELAKRSYRSDSLGAVEIAMSLIRKDRLDARLLGVESLCILTDPRTAHMPTAVTASHAILGGSPVGDDTEGPIRRERTLQGRDENRGGEETMGVGAAAEMTESTISENDERPYNEGFDTLRRFLLTLIQKKTMDDEGVILDRMDTDYDSDDDEEFIEADKTGAKPTDYLVALESMQYFALTVLANSLDVLTSCPQPFLFDNAMHDDGTDSDKSSRVHSRPASVESIVDAFHACSVEATGESIISSLRNELGRAERKPHNAAMAAKCIRLLLGASESFQLENLKDGLLGLCRRAIGIGKNTHARLEYESTALLGCLTNPAAAASTAGTTVGAGRL